MSVERFTFDIASILGLALELYQPEKNTRRKYKFNEVLQNRI